MRSNKLGPIIPTLVMGIVGVGVGTVLYQTPTSPDPIIMPLIIPAETTVPPTTIQLRQSTPTTVHKKEKVTRDTFAVETTTTTTSTSSTTVAPVIPPAPPAPVVIPTTVAPTTTRAVTRTTERDDD